MAIDVSWHLSVLSNLARAGSWDDEICISSNRRITLESRTKLPWLIQRIITIVVKAFENLLSTLLHCTIVLIDQSKKHEDLTATITTLKSMFGSRRVDRNLTWCSINVGTLYDDGRCLSKQDIASLFHSFALITKEDVEELIEELNGSQNSVRGIDKEQLSSLRSRFRGKEEISSCSPDEIRDLEAILLPFARPQDQFWNDPAKRGNSISFPMTTFEMIETVAWARHLIKTRNFPLKDWESLFGKRFAQPQLPLSLILPHPNNGYICFSHVVEGGGASKRFFRSLHPENVPPIILYRGTRGPMPGDGIFDTVSSWLEDLRRELGSSGPIATYEETKQLLEDPAKGFVQTPDQKIALVTNSIGGAQGQRDALCFHHRVLSITTNCSPGVDTETAELFREMMSKPRQTPMIITHNIDKGDIVDTVGDEHIGGNCPNVRLTFRSLSLSASTTMTEDSQWTTATRLHDFLFSGFSSLFSNIIGIFEAHVRATAGEAYKEEVISTENLLTRELADAYAQHKPPHFDPSWERARRFLCPAPSPGFAEFARKHLS